MRSCGPGTWLSATFTLTLRGRVPCGTMRYRESGASLMQGETPDGADEVDPEPYAPVTQTLRLDARTGVACDAHRRGPCPSAYATPVSTTRKSLCGDPPTAPAAARRSVAQLLAPAAPPARPGRASPPPISRRAPGAQHAVDLCVSSPSYSASSSPCRPQCLALDAPTSLSKRNRLE